MFIAQQMKLRGSPLHVEHRHEKKIFNDFMAQHPRPTSKHWRELAKLFKLLSNYKTIFPKLPSMLKAYYTRWKDTQKIVMAQEEMKASGYHELLIELAMPLAPSDAASAAIQTQLSVPRELNEGVNVSVFMDEMPENPLPAPPVAAPGQTSFVPSAGGTRRDQRCCYFPSCNKMASECNGYKSGMCVEVSSGRVSLPSPEELARLKSEASKKLKAQQARDRRERRKRQKTEELEDNALN